MGFGELLRSWRKARGVSALELDRHLRDRIRDERITPRYTSQIEHRRLRAPDVDICEAIAAVLGLEPAHVVTESMMDRANAAGVGDWLRANNPHRAEVQALQSEVSSLRSTLAAVKAALEQAS